MSCCGHPPGQVVCPKAVHQSVRQTRQRRELEHGPYGRWCGREEAVRSLPIPISRALDAPGAVVHMKRILICLSTLGLLAGCAAIGPTSSPECPRLVAKAVPNEDGQIHFFGPGNWHPNTRGFTAVRSSLLAR